MNVNITVTVPLLQKHVIMAVLIPTPAVNVHAVKTNLPARRCVMNLVREPRNLARTAAEAPENAVKKVPVVHLLVLPQEEFGLNRPINRFAGQLCLVTARHLNLIQ